MYAGLENDDICKSREARPLWLRPPALALDAAT